MLTSRLIELTLEELDRVFSVSTRHHARYQIKNAIWHFRTWILRQKLEPLPKLYELDEVNPERTESVEPAQSSEHTEQTTEKRANGSWPAE